MRILKFYSPTCGPCKVMDSNLKEANVSYENINILENDELVSEYGIRAVPTIIKVDDKGGIDRRVGIINVEQIKEFVYGTND